MSLARRTSSARPDERPRPRRGPASRVPGRLLRLDTFEVEGSSDQRQRPSFSRSTARHPRPSMFRPMWVMRASSSDPRVRSTGVTRGRRRGALPPTVRGRRRWSAGMEVPERATTPSGDPIMTAKFLVPAAKAPVVPRPRLFERLTSAVRGPLTLVSAPAGSGKTVLVSMWAASGDAPGPLVWISLDEEDHQPGVFWSYVLAGLARAGLDSGKMRPPDRNEVVEHSLLVRLAAALSERSAPIVLVLDNAEALTRQQIFDDLDFLLGHSAGRLRLVLVTRVDPNLPLPQYRLARSVTEIRFPELAFTPDEARQLLAGRKPELSDTAVLAFSYRTRGWAAGLRLVGRRGRPRRPAGRRRRLRRHGHRPLLPHRGAGRRNRPGSATCCCRRASSTSSTPSSPSCSRARGRPRRRYANSPRPASSWTWSPAARAGTEARRTRTTRSSGTCCGRRLRHQSPTRTRRLHRKAARWLAESGRTSEAMRQYAVAEDWEEAAQLLVLEHGVGRLLAAGPADGLAETFARMPAATSGPAAAVARAALAVQQGDLVAADKQLARAGELVTDLDGAGEPPSRWRWPSTRMIRAAVGGDGAGGARRAPPSSSPWSRKPAHRPTRTSEPWHCSLLPGAGSCWGSWPSRARCSAVSSGRCRPGGARCCAATPLRSWRSWRRRPADLTAAVEAAAGGP